MACMSASFVLAAALRAPAIGGTPRPTWVLLLYPTLTGIENNNNNNLSEVSIFISKFSCYDVFLVILPCQFVLF